MAEKSLMERCLGRECLLEGRTAQVHKSPDPRYAGVTSQDGRLAAVYSWRYCWHVLQNGRQFLLDHAAR